MRERRLVHSTSRPTPVLRMMFLIALVLIVHQIVMATPVHARVMPLLSAGPAVGDRESVAPMRGLCPHCPISSATICPAVQAVFPTILAALTLIVAFLILPLLGAAATGPRTYVQAVWHPPPKHTLVLFQVMRC